jgi:DNA-binding IclR family transcriptional regulator
MREGARDRRDGSVQVLAKAAAILDRVADEQEATASRLAHLVGEPRSTVYRLLASLRALELVEPGSRPATYRLGLKLFRLGSAVTARFDERQAALPIMERIHQATGETVFLCIRRGDEAVCIERIDGRRVQSLALRLGGSLPLHIGAAPTVLLAYEPQECWEQYVARNKLEALTPKTSSTRDAIFRRLTEVRRLGYAVSDEDVTLGIAAVGAPIFDYRGRLRAALSVSGVRPAILGANANGIRDLVVEGAQDVSISLGFAAHAEEAGHG